MKLPLIAVSVLAYTVLAMAWICYAELALPEGFIANPLF